jgi:hypothetical protein
MHEVPKEQISARVDDWIDRLHNLRKLVESWVTELYPDGSVAVVDAGSRPMHEQLMVTAGVEDRQMECFDIVSGSERLAAFRPKALWVVGANGRIDIVCRKRIPMLIDLARPHDPPDWTILDSHQPAKRVKFDRTSFQQLLTE